MLRLARALCCAALAAAVSSFGIPSASAAQDGLLRLAHLSPDTPAVDVYVDSVADPAARVMLPGVGYGTVSPYRPVPPGIYSVAMRAAGASPSTPPVLSTTVQVDAGSAKTVAGVGHFADLGLTVLADDLTPPPAGQARLRVISAAAGASSVDVSVVGGAQLAQGLAFGKAGGYVTVPGGAATLSVTPSGGTAARVPVTLDAGSVYSLLVLDRKGGGLSVQPVLDAAGSGVMPAGGVETGAGGAARPFSNAVAGLATAVGALAATGFALTVVPRWRRPRRRGRHSAGT
jgi:hypothetical protein